MLSIEQFNRPVDQGRVSAFLILLDHSFEMFLKAAIIHLNGNIWEKDKPQTIGFDKCVRLGLSEPKFLSEEQALTLQTINGLRDAAQHHILEISEEQLYLHAQAGITLFKDILKNIFKIDLTSRLPARVLPISTVAPTDVSMLFDVKIEEIKKLLVPGRRKRTEAYARLRPLAILDATIRGEKLQPSIRDLGMMGKQIIEGKSWEEIFPGVASIQFTIDGASPSISLHITKKEGVPVQLVPEGTPGASVIAVKRVNELSFYSLGHKELAKHVGLNSPQLTAVKRYIDLNSRPDCCKEITIGKSKFYRYSQNAIPIIKKTLEEKPIEMIWEEYRPRRRRADLK
ncbi:DUF3644 domain-containing protein [Methanothrix sp.]|uniref:DUF3644 domain-containing protein n=1 Tax=Methanothrix sp. TaxID=90426 RepID=UPI00338EFE30